MLNRKGKRLVAAFIITVLFICGIKYTAYAIELSQEERESEYEKQLEKIENSIYDMESEVKCVEVDEVSNYETAEAKLKEATGYAENLGETVAINEAVEYQEKAYELLGEVSYLLDDIRQTSREKLAEAKIMKELTFEKKKESQKILDFELSGIRSDSELHEKKKNLEEKSSNYWEETKEKLQNVIATIEDLQEKCSNLESEVVEVSSKCESLDQRLESVQVKLENLWSESVSMDSDLEKYAEVITFNCSAYDACFECSEGYDTNTASGATAVQYRTVAASPEYPFGTRLYIPYFKNCPNGGWFTVEDRGGAIKGNKLDIYMGSHAETEIFGRQNLTVYVFRK